MISGATNTTHTISTSGVYKVQANNGGCLSVFSLPVTYVVTEIERDLNRTISIYPNPTQDEIFISLTGFESTKPVAISVITLNGQRMHEASVTGNEARVNVQHYGSGQYLVLMQQGKRRVAKSFIKSN